MPMDAGSAVPGRHGLMDYFPRLLEGGQVLLPYARPGVVGPCSVLLLAAQWHRRPGEGQGIPCAMCLVHNSPSCPQCT